MPVVLCFFIFVGCDKEKEATNTERFFGGNEKDLGECIAPTNDGGFIIAGSTESSGAGSSDAYLIKTNSSGRSLWLKTYGGEYADGANSVQQTADGGYIIAGFKTGPGILDRSAWLIKTDQDGNFQWERTYPSSGGTHFVSVVQGSDNGFLAVGSEEFKTYNSTYSVMLIIKTDEAGNIIWKRTCNGSHGASGASIIQTDDNKFMICGESINLELDKIEVYLVKIDSNGDTLWTRTCGIENKYAGGYSVVETTNHDLIICGYEKHPIGYENRNAEILLIKADENGDTLWTRTFGGIGDDYGYCVAETQDQGFILCGSTESFGAGNTNVYLVRTDDQGEMLWSKTFGGPEEDLGASVLQSDGGDYVIAGSTASYGAGDYDVYFIKTSRD